jgi:hypothetical protein
MSSCRAVPLLAALLALFGLPRCGEARLIGRSCEPQGCPRTDAVLPRPDGCGTQFVLPLEEIASGDSRERCYLFTIDGLESPADDDRVFITRVAVAIGPSVHDLDLRLAESLRDYPDGRVDCAELGTRAVAWLPLMTTQGTSDTWTFEPAPLLATSSHRLLITDTYTNFAPDPVAATVQVNLHCASSLPETVSQAFSFTSREQLEVKPGVRAAVSGACVFSKDVEVSRLYRPTRFVTRYSARRLGEEMPIWQSSVDWFVDLEPPLPIPEDDGFGWECVYENRTDLPFQIGHYDSDACSLFGIYRVPSGGAGLSPEHCSVR